MNSFNFPKTAAEPGASEKPCGRLGRLLGALGRALSPLDRLLESLEALLEPPGALLAASWSLFGRSWGALGASWAPLGRLGGDQNMTTITWPKKVNFQTPQRRILLRYGRGFGRSKSTKIGAKTSQNLRRFSRAKKLLFKSLLEPSWADLGAFWRPSWGSKNRCGIGRRSVW